MQNLAEICVRSINAHFYMICDTYSAFLYPDSKNFQNLTKNQKSLCYGGLPHIMGRSVGVCKKRARKSRDLLVILIRSKFDCLTPKIEKVTNVYFFAVSGYQMPQIGEGGGVRLSFKGILG